MSLDMSGFIDDLFESTNATRYFKTGGDYVNGRWVEGVEGFDNPKVNIQPATMKQIQHLELGGERVVDVRQVWINDGKEYNIAEADEWVFEGVPGRFKCLPGIDNRGQFSNSRNYCKCLVSLIDGSITQ